MNNRYYKKIFFCIFLSILLLTSTIILVLFDKTINSNIKNSENTISVANYTSKNFSFKWSYDMDLEDPGTKIGPLSVDVNDDGIYEVFATGKNKVVCIDGASGSLIWEYHGIWSQHTPFEIHDLNNDGIPELVISASLRTIALHANNGSVYWNVKVESSNKHLVIADIDGSGFPYVYICSDDLDHGANGTGRLRKLRGTDGKVLKEVFAWYPCFGGLSLAYDAHDGRFKVYMTDRAYGSSNPYAKGMQCYDAETLELLWYEDEVWCASHCMAIVDVNSDRILDAVALHQSGGIYVIDGSTGKKMPDKCSKSLGLKAHSSFSIYDIDGDGNLELCTCCVSSVKVWDLGRWELDATLAVASDPPMMADVIGDSDLEIICVGSKVNIYDGTYTLVETLDIGGRTTLVQDIDGDGLNEFILLSESGLMRVYDTLAIAPTPRVRTNSLYYSERRMGAGIYTEPPSQKAPFIENELPSNNSINVPLNPTLSAKIFDLQNDTFDIIFRIKIGSIWKTIKEYINQNVKNFTNFTANTYSYVNNYNTKYDWSITVIDSNENVNQKIFSFKTEPTPIEQPPKANFLFSPAYPTILDEIFFTDTSLDSDGSIISWLWDFDDESTSADRNPVHQFTNEETYNITLTVTDTGGETDTTIQTIVVTSPIPGTIDQEQTLHKEAHKIYADHWAAQSFIPTVDTITKVELLIFKTSNIPNDIIVSIRNSLTGNDLTSILLSKSSISSNPNWITFDFPNIPVISGDTYYIVVHTDGGSYSECYCVEYYFGNPYTNGSIFVMNNESPWGPYPMYDFCFKAYGYIE